MFSPFKPRWNEGNADEICRYIDAVQVLYTSNTFDFDCMESLISFSTSILPHRFDSIQNIRLDLRFDQSHFFCEGTPTTDYTRWERMWRIIGSMKSLQHLWCRIIWWRPDITGAEEARYMSEMLQVGRLKLFEVSLPALKWDDEKEKHVEATFDIVRRPMRRWILAMYVDTLYKSIFHRTLSLVLFREPILNRKLFVTVNCQSASYLILVENSYLAARANTWMVIINHSSLFCFFWII